MARYYFGASNAIGKYVTFDRNTTPYEIIGIAGNAKYFEIREATRRAIYLNALQLQRPPATFALRTSVDPQALASAARRTALDLLKNVPVARVTTLAEQVDATIVPERLIALLSGVFGALASVLAAIGIYGLLAYTVARRVNEIGIRMALGATQSIVSRMVLREALGITCGGLAIGVPLAYWSKRLAASLLQDLPKSDVYAIASAAVTMLAIALVASYLPALRAARVDPMEALRHE
jgi:predicted lysophospholipase L1 biosynthesis ABC-type transport system permease subunit